MQFSNEEILAMSNGDFFGQANDLKVGLIATNSAT